MGEEQTVITVADLVQKYFRKTVLAGVSFHLAPGESLGIFGLRGSGKSSLLHILAGVDRFTSGTVQVLGCNIRKNQQYKQHTGLVTQEPSLFLDLNVLENLDFIAALKNAGAADVKRVIDLMELQDCLRRPLSALDPGLYQRLALACALVNSPQLIFLDELVKDVDLYSRHLMLQNLQPFLNSGGAVVCGFSNLEFATYFDRVGWLENGQLEIFEPRAAQQKWQLLLESYEKPGVAND